MQDEINRLMKKLDQERVEPWYEEMKLGKPVYEHIFNAVKESSTTERQTCHGLEALFRLRHHGDEMAYFEMLRKLSTSENKNIRSTATKLFIGMLNLSRNPGHIKVKIPNTVAEQNVIRGALGLGLESNVEILANEFLAL